MPKYTLDATITVCLENVTIRTDSDIGEELELHDALLQKLASKLVLLDHRGSVSGDGGIVSHIECDCIDNWNKA